MRFTLLLLFSLCTSFLLAQIVNPKKVKYGKISDAELELTEYAPQPDAEAVVLVNEGRLRMDYDISTGNFEVVMDRHYRIKLLKATAVSTYGDYSFVLEHSTTSNYKEEVINIRSVTVNMEDGDAVETKLGRDAIFREEISERLDRLTLSFPQVKEGSIIDLKYTYKSDFLYNLPTWYFQKRIPTDYSFFEAIIPDYYYYKLDMLGFASGTMLENTTGELGSRTITVGTGRTEPLNMTTRGYRWAIKEVLGMTDEPYAPHVSNFFFRIDFELASVNFPGQLGTHFSHTWDDVAKTYRDNGNMRPYLNPRSDVSELATNWTDGLTEEAAKAVAIYEHTKDRLEWDGRYRISPTQTPANLLKTGAGSSAELNSFLISALRAAGIAAYPVLCSTRENGYLSVTRPSLSQFNHQLAYVSLNEGASYLLLDATHKSVPAPLLPLADLNDRGRIVMEETSDWIALNAPAGRKTAIQLNMIINEEGTCSGGLKYKSSDYAALFDRLEAADQGDIGQVLEERMRHPLATVEVEGFEDTYEELVVNAQLNVSDNIMDNGELLYMPALLSPAFTENPLKAEERVLPIDFSTPQEAVYVMQLELPENMTLEELPESVSFALPDGKGRYALRFIDMNGNVQVVEQFSIKESIFTSEDYAALRNFFDLVIEQQQAMLVLRKS